VLLCAPWRGMPGMTPAFVEECHRRPPEGVNPPGTAECRRPLHRARLGTDRWCLIISGITAGQPYQGQLTGQGTTHHPHQPRSPGTPARTPRHRRNQTPPTIDLNGHVRSLRLVSLDDPAPPVFCLHGCGPGRRPGPGRSRPSWGRGRAGRWVGGEDDRRARFLVEVEIGGQVAEDPAVLTDIGARIGAAVRLRVEPRSVQEVVLDELVVGVERQGLVIDVTRPGYGLMTIEGTRRP
jgi:hypothetical protein